MNIKDINNINEFDFDDYSLEETEKVLRVMEEANWSNLADKNLEENSGFCTRLLDIVDRRVSNNTFSELVDNPEGKSHLLLRVLRIRTSISQYRLMVLRDEVQQEVRQQAEIANQQFKTTRANIDNIVTDTQKNLQKMSEDTVQKINKHLTESENRFEQKLSKGIRKATNKIEPQLMTTVLTLMGVFSAVITIIMSIVITSSSWLNNANSASAVIAFIVPNLVAVFSIVVLLGVVFSRKDAEIVVISSNGWDQENTANNALKKLKRLRVAVFSVIFVFAVVLMFVSVYEINNSSEPHSRYVLSPGMYECKEIQEDNAELPVFVIAFEINEKAHVFPYKEEYFHDDKLYFCEEHQQLE